MSSRRVRENMREVRINYSSFELSTNLAEYIAELSESSIKEHGTFAVAISGGSLISLMRYYDFVIFSTSSMFLIKCF